LLFEIFLQKQQQRIQNSELNDTIKRPKNEPAKTAAVVTTISSEVHAKASILLPLLISASGFFSPSLQTVHASDKSDASVGWCLEFEVVVFLALFLSSKTLLVCTPLARTFLYRPTRLMHAMHKMEINVYDLYLPQCCVNQKKQ